MSAPAGDEYAPSDAISPKDVKEDQWVRVLPTALGEFEKLGYKHAAVKQVPPLRGSFSVDWKSTPLRCFFAHRWNLLCDERVLRALERIGATGWSASPVAHASPNPVRGHRLYELELPGRLGRPLSAVEKTHPDRVVQFGAAGSPVPPVVLDGSVWSGDAICLTEWLDTDTIGPFQALVVRGDFIAALAGICGGEPPVVLQPVDVAGLPPLPRPARAVGVWHPAPAPWSHPSGWSGNVRDRVVATARHYRHFLPPPPDRAEFERVAAELERRYQGKLGPELRQFMLASNGASLFAGMLTFFPIGKRTAENAVPNYIAGDDIALANSRVSADDWKLQRDPGWILFAARYASFHAIWAMNPDGLIRLLPQTGDVLGPELPFDAWLEDQVADLEWAWDDPDALGRDRATWLDLPEREPE